MSGKRFSSVLLMFLALAAPVRGEKPITLDGHPGTVEALAFAPDGRCLAVGDGKSDIWLWELSSRKVRMVFRGHLASVRALAFTADGRTLLSGSGDCTVKFWDVQTGKELRSLTPNPGRGIVCLALSPDGKTLVTGADRATANLAGRCVKVWDMATGKHLEDREVSEALCLAVGPNGRLVVGSNARARFWANGRDAPRSILDKPVHDVAFSPDGKTLALGSEGPGIRLYDVAAGKLGPTLERPDATPEVMLEGGGWCVPLVAFSPSGTLLAAADYLDESIRVYDPRTGKQRFAVKAKPNLPGNLVFSAGDKFLAIPHESSVILFNVAALRPK